MRIIKVREKYYKLVLLLTGLKFVIMSNSRASKPMWQKIPIAYEIDFLARRKNSS